MWARGRAKPGTLPLGWRVCVLNSGGSAGQQVLLGSCLFMGHRGRTHWLDLKSCPAPLAVLSPLRRRDVFALAIPCPELAVLGRCKEGAGTKAHLALTPHPRLGRCSSPRCQHPGKALGCPPVSCRTPRVAQSGVWVANGSGSAPGQGCGCCWCRQGPWRGWKPNACRAGGGQGGGRAPLPTCLYLSLGSQAEIP